MSRFRGSIAQEQVAGARLRRLRSDGKRIGRLRIVACLAFAAALLSPALDAAESIREPAVAGSFYPSDPGALRQQVRTFLDQAPLLIHRAPVALVAPHAGYVFSGQTAADAFRQAEGRTYSLVVILGTNHTVAGFDRASVYLGDGYRTPLGVAPIDRELAESLIRDSKDFIFDARLHRREHSIEVQLPFVQVLFPDSPILPIVVGSSRPDFCRRIARELIEKLAGRSVLFVASSDLSHYPPEEVARRVDSTILQRIVEMDPAAFRTEAARQLDRGQNLVTRACGEAPILVAMEAARQLGVRRGTLIHYANSADSSAGDRSRVVGYGAVALVPRDDGASGPASSRASASGSPDLSDTQKRFLLETARRAIRDYLATESAPVPDDPDHAFSFPSGLFVTLRKQGRLRGCIGHLEADRPLLEGVVRTAIYAAVGDSRFQPVRAEEVPELTIEISLLTPMRAIDGIDRIRVGRDGVVLRKEGHSATFLPQVATEQHWDRTELLDRLCRKAGLSEKCWQSGASLETFQAVVFGEPDPADGTPP